MPHDLAIVIRTSGERTQEECLRLVERQGLNVPISVIAEKPFERALIKTYEIGVTAGRRWTMTIDGDVLAREGAAARLLAAAKDMPADYAQIEGYVLDKLLGIYRYAGHRIYRTELLAKAAELVPPPGQQIRPEFHTLQRLAVLGYRSRRVSVVFGIHDYQQYYRDVYRKGIVHGRKHRELASAYMQRTSTELGDDPDFRVLRRALRDVEQNVSTSPERVLQKLSLTEKPPLGKLGDSFLYVENVLRGAGAPNIVPPYDLLSDGEWGGPAETKPARWKGSVVDIAARRLRSDAGDLWRRFSSRLLQVACVLPLT